MVLIGVKVLNENRFAVLIEKQFYGTALRSINDVRAILKYNLQTRSTSIITPKDSPPLKKDPPWLPQALSPSVQSYCWGQIASSRKGLLYPYSPFTEGSCRGRKQERGKCRTQASMEGAICIFHSQGGRTNSMMYAPVQSLQRGLPYVP